jgi:hypothetical protein
MCKELIPQIKFACSHILDNPADLVEWEGCRGCGIKKAGPEYLGGTTKRTLRRLQAARKGMGSE